MVVAKRRIEGSFSPGVKARLAILWWIAAITFPVRVPVMIGFPLGVWLCLPVQFGYIVLLCNYLRQPCSVKT